MRVELKRVLWVSGCPPDPDARAALGDGVYEEVEILWPVNREAVADILENLLANYDLVTGVFPVQVIEALNLLPYRARRCRFVLSPVFQPGNAETQDQRFKFVRWACLWSNRLQDVQAKVEEK